MLKEKIAEMKSEINRLNKIIDILIYQNDLLVKNISNSNVGSGKSVEDISPNNVGSGKSVEDISTSNIGSGKSIEDTSTSILAGGKNLSGLSTSMSGSGNITKKDTSAMSVDGNNLSKSLPAILPLSPLNINKLSGVIRRDVIRRGRRDTAVRVAQLLLHFHNKEKGGYAELCKMTHHKYDGLAKLIMILKRRGLIHRTGFQQFAPTQRSLELIEKAGCTEDGV